MLLTVDERGDLRVQLTQGGAPIGEDRLGIPPGGAGLRQCRLGPLDHRRLARALRVELVLGMADDPDQGSAAAVCPVGYVDAQTQVVERSGCEQVAGRVRRALL